MKATLIIFMTVIALLGINSLSAETFEREISLGYNATKGNTETGALSVRASMKRKSDKDEIIFKGDYYVSSSNEKMDAKKWYGSGYYSFNLAKKWYNFYKLEVDHDRFANIDVRLMPSVGVSYRLIERDDLKFSLELGLGYEYTGFRDNSAEKDVVLTPRLSFEKKLFGEAIISQSLAVYPKMGDISRYRWRSETSITNPLSEKLDLKLSLIHDFNSDPSGNAEKGDLRFISSIVYRF